MDEVLTPWGLWVVQFQDLHQMLGAMAFDDICHEHLFYPSLAAVERMVAPFDLHVIDAEHRAINGGSLRLTIGRTWRAVSARVKALRDAETGCEDLATLARFAECVYHMRQQLHVVLSSLEGLTVDLYGASTKGNTLLQFCALGPEDIRQAWERSSEKVGRKTVTGIPIVSEEIGRRDPPGMLLVGIWQFRDAIIQREREYLQHGGRMLFPLPRVEIVEPAYAGHQ